MECGMGGQPYKTPHFHPRYRQPPPVQLRSDLTASAPVSDVSAPVCWNGHGFLCRLWVWRIKIRPSTMLSSNIQSIDLRALTVLDDETMERLLNTCPKINCSLAVVGRTGSKDEEKFVQQCQFGMVVLNQGRYSPGRRP